MNQGAAGKAQFEGYGRNHGIDMLRGLSILLVIFNHVGIRIPLAKTGLAAFAPERLLHAINYRGYEGVFIFFVISGFLITTNALQRWGSLDRISFKAFYSRRFARIAPCLVALVLVLSLLHVVGADGYVIHRPGQSLAGAILSALGLHLNWYEGQTGWLPAGWDVLWSLSIEEMFYLGFPIICLLTRRLWVLVPLLVVLALSLPITRGWAHGNEIWLEKAYLPGMAAIATGVLGALIARHFRPSRMWAVRLLIALGALALATTLLAEIYVWHLVGEGFMLLLTISTMALIVGMHWRHEMKPQRQALRGFGWLRSLGFHSYEIYLTHMFVVLSAVALFRANGSDMQLGYLWYLPSILLSWLLGVAVARWFSIPSDRRLRNYLLAPEAGTDTRVAMPQQPALDSGATGRGSSAAPQMRQ
ncbi:MAG TPA: acyltransferase [Gammaproteobacteria bacterium]|nr:acyltransferase [Gammaproteobacteria bacterium]